MPSFPRKKGSTAGRRQFFRNEGASEAGAPGTKTELRRAKHRVAATDAGRGRCPKLSRTTGDQCHKPIGHSGTHLWGARKAPKAGVWYKR